jgi:ketosteroid isomerase-like protein
MSRSRITGSRSDWPRPDDRFLHRQVPRRLVRQLLAGDHPSVEVQPSGTVTLVFTDVEGSTAPLDGGADAYEETLADHRRIVREALVRTRVTKSMRRAADGNQRREPRRAHPLYESQAAFATHPGSLAHGTPGVREALAGFISMKGKLELEVTRVPEVGDLALVTGSWLFNGTGPDGEPVRLAPSNADVLRRQAHGGWRFVIDNPWGTD